MHVALLLACAKADPAPEQNPPLEIVALKVGTTQVDAEVADSPDERRLGLMHRTAMEADHGMLFVYPDEALRSFWMKNTQIPLSIAYLDATGRIVHIADMVPFDTRAVPSQRPAQFALEMNKGWFGRHGVKVGQKVEGLPAPAAD